MMSLLMVTAKCSYCKNEHGIIGDVVCPIFLATTDLYQRKANSRETILINHLNIDLGPSTIDILNQKLSKLKEALDIIKSEIDETERYMSLFS